jgi:serine/threonine-protein kinase HipA
MPQNGVNVFVNQDRVGSISRSDIEADTYLFGYNAGLEAQLAVSLTMPVVADQYDSMGFLHPIFEMNLPEGALRERLERMFAKVVRDFDALALLDIVGRSQIGRVHYATTEVVSEEMPTENVSQLLAYQGAEDLFADLFERFASHSGVSGMQPKVLVRDAALSLDKITDKGATHIVKSFNPAEYPELAANEYFSMQAARHAGLPTANVHLSKNRQILVVERFDRSDVGSYLGFEDFCVLSGQRASGRYNGSYEALARQAARFVSPVHHPRAMRQLFGMVALSCIIRNGDAHLKNFAVLYDAPGINVRLAPVYDMLTTAPYLPKDVMALEMDGSKSYPTLKQLVAFGRNACGLSKQNTEAVLESTAHGVKVALNEMHAYVERHPDFAKRAEIFERVFRDGLTLASGSH